MPRVAEKSDDWYHQRLTQRHNSKVHALVDEQCRSWAFVPTPSNTAECMVAEACAIERCFCCLKDWQHITTNRRATFSLHCASSPCWPIGFESIDSGLYSGFR